MTKLFFCYKLIALYEVLLCEMLISTRDIKNSQKFNEFLFIF